MVKLIVKVIREKRDCYVSLPRGFGSTVGEGYSSNSICSAVRVTRLSKEKLFLGYAAGVSKAENEIEISFVFAECISLTDGEPVDVELEPRTESAMKLELTVNSSDSYELVCGMREKFEESLLNQIGVLFDGIRFPAYFSESQFVVFTFNDASTDSTSRTACRSIHPSAELVILPPPEEVEKQNGTAQVEGEDDEDIITNLKLRCIERHYGNEFRAKIPRSLFNKHKLQQNKLYRLQVEQLLRESDYTDFKTFVSKQQQSKSKSDGKTAGKIDSTSAMVMLVPTDDEQISENTIVINDFMAFALKTEAKAPLKIDLLYELDNIKDNRILTISDFAASTNKIKLVFRQIHSLRGRSELSQDHGWLLSQVIKRSLLGEADAYYSDQLFNVNGNYYVLRIVDNQQDQKIILKSVLFENHVYPLQNPNKDEDTSVNFNWQKVLQDNPTLTGQIGNNIVFASQQEYFNEYSEFEVIAMNKLVKSKLRTDPILPVNIGIYQVLYGKDLEKLQKCIRDDTRYQRVSCVSGNSQSGKTFMSEYLRHQFVDHHVEIIDFAELQESVLIEYAKAYILSKIQLACLKEPSIVICDNLEHMCKSLERIDFQQFQLVLVSEIISKFLKDKIKKYSRATNRVSFLLLADSKESINANLPKVVDLQVSLEIAGYSKRKEVFEYLERICDMNLNIDDLGAATENFTLNEFFLLSRMIVEERKIINEQDIFEKVRILSNQCFKSTKSFPKFDHVGGLEIAKDIVKETFEVPIKYEFLFKKIPVKLPRGVLLFGPPGCGKTFLAKATANELGLNFFSIKGPEILNKYIGASEQAVRDIFEKAYAVRPSIVFFDEFDAIVPRRNSGSTGVTDRVVNQFLCYLDGVASLDGVCILAASSRPDLIDPALLRPGRIDRHVYLGFPEEAERRKILSIYTKNLVYEEGLGFEDIVKVTEDFTSADLVAFLKETRIKMAHDLIEAKKQDEKLQLNFTLTSVFLKASRSQFRPSLNKAEIARFQSMYEKFADPKAVQDITKQKQTLH